MNPDCPTFNEYSQIRRMALRAPEEAFRQQQTIDEQWERLHYYGKPDFEESMEEHQGLREILSVEGIEILMIPGSEKLFLDSIYVRDSMINSPEGLILASMGKAERPGEPRVSAKQCESFGFSILGSIDFNKLSASFCVQSPQPISAFLQAEIISSCISTGE